MTASRGPGQGLGTTDLVDLAPRYPSDDIR